MIYFKANITNGKFEADKKKFTRLTSNMMDGSYLLMFIKVNDKSQLEWQRFYRAVLAEVSLDTGESKDWLHEQLKADVLPFVVEEGESLTTTTLTPFQWKLYLEHIAQWLHEKYDYII